MNFKTRFCTVLIPALLGGLVFLFPFTASADEAWTRIEQSKELRWGADVVGGAPYVFSAEDAPDNIIGFEVDMMEAICRRLGVRPKLVNVQWDQLVPALSRNDFDVAFNGLEITKERQDVIDFTIPYYLFSQQITCRKNDERFQKFTDLRGHRVGTLSATLAQSLMEADGQITVVPYPSPVEAYKDLDIGRIDAVLLDVPIAAWYVANYTNLQNTGEPVGEGIYAGGIRKDSPVLKQKINEALAALIESGELEAIYRKWHIWNAGQSKLKEAARQGTIQARQNKPLSAYIPLLLKGAAVTVTVSCLAMAVAVCLGFLLCISRLYGPAPLKALASTYIEIVRGTPLLIQLYLIYYGLPNIGIQLNAFCAAVLGMGLNYAAYEAEIYRAGLISIPKGQDEAARSLGMSGWQSLRFILLPQAARTILPPSTNDFIALFKDTSLVSIITVTELTRSYSQAATNTYRFLELGLMTAALYFLMSFPLSRWSRHMEKKQHVTMH